MRIAWAAAVSGQQTVCMLAAATVFVDESFRRCPDGRGLFLLAAVAVPDGGQAAAEQWLRGTVAPGQRRWHFRDESAAARRRFIAVLAEREMSGVQALTFCGWTPSQRKAEQARVRALWSLLAELPNLRANRLVIESRQEHNDRKDRREILGAQRAGVAAPDLVYRHGQPKLEPPLWLPDAIAGAIGMSLADGQHELFSALPESMRQVRWIGP